jgi:hypothetical protein
MRGGMNRHLRAQWIGRTVAICMAACATAAVADRASAEDAVTEVLWDYEDSFEFVQYSVSDSGHVVLTFASNTPDDLYSEIVTRIRNHPGVDSVLPGRDGGVCSLFSR